VSAAVSARSSQVDILTPPARARACRPATADEIFAKCPDESQIDWEDHMAKAPAFYVRVIEIPRVGGWYIEWTGHRFFEVLASVKRMIPRPFRRSASPAGRGFYVRPGGGCCSARFSTGLSATAAQSRSSTPSCRLTGAMLTQSNASVG
jgi:hypothetical protein